MVLLLINRHLIGVIHRLPHLLSQEVVKAVPRQATIQTAIRVAVAEVFQGVVPVVVVEEAVDQDLHAEAGNSNFKTINVYSI